MKRSLKKIADFLGGYCRINPNQNARNTICPQKVQTLPWHDSDAVCFFGCVFRARYLGLFLLAAVNLLPTRIPKAETHTCIYPVAWLVFVIFCMPGTSAFRSSSMINLRGF